MLEHGSSERIFPSRKQLREVKPSLGDQVPQRVPQRVRHVNRRQRSKFIRILLVVLVLLLVAIPTALGAYRAGWFESSPKSAQSKILTFEIAGRQGAAVTMKLDSPVTESQVGFHLLQAGHGRKIIAGQRVYARVTSFSGNTGKLKNTAPVEFLGKAGIKLFPPDLYKFVVGHDEGDRIAVVRDISNSASDIEVSIIDIMPTVAKGNNLTKPQDAQFWAVEKSGQPELVLSGTVDTKQTRAYPVITGAGEQIHADSKILVQLKVIDANSHEVKNSTWSEDSLPEVVKLTELMTPLANALADQTVGSRLVVLVPAAQADGNAPVYVIVDILGISA